MDAFNKFVAKDAKSTSPSEIEESFAANRFAPVYEMDEIVKDLYPEDLEMFIEQPSDLKDKYEYERNGTDAGLVVIFNHERFSNAGVGFRKGSRKDVNELIQSLGRVGYNIKKQYIHNDLTRKEIMKVLTELSEEDHSERNCLIVVFLSHGEDSNKLSVEDGYITTTEIWENFANCETLKNKPKLFIFQACKGNNTSYSYGESQLNKNVNLIPADTFTIPFAPDMLIVYTAVEGNSSYRNTLTGSWFIQELCKNILSYGKREDVVSIITRTTKSVASTYFFYSNETSQPIGKQMPVFISTLRKRFYLTRSKERNLLLSLVQGHNDLAETVSDLKKKVDELYQYHLENNKKLPKINRAQ